MAAAPLLEGLFPGIDPRWLYAVRTLVTAGTLAVLWRHFVELRDAPSGEGVAWAAGIGTLVFVLWITLDTGFLVIGESQGFDPRVEGRLHAGFVLTRLAGAALVVPVMEELFWRGFLLRWLEHPRFLDVDPRAVGWKAIALSSVVFATEHRLWLAGLLAGVAYAWLYRRTGNLWATVIAHAVTNAALGVWVLTTGSWQYW
jgi:CAAX prenyl protease-like protein